MVVVGAIHPHHHHKAAPGADSGVNDALSRYFTQTYGGDYAAAVRRNPRRALHLMQRNLGIREHGLGPQTRAALQDYAPPRTFVEWLSDVFGGHSSPAAAQPAVEQRRSARARTQGLVQPVSYGPIAHPRQSSPSSGFGWFGGSSAAQAELARVTGGRYQPNHIYVVQIDRNNDGANTGALKGRTAVFTTDASGAPRLRGTFTSSSQPTGADPYFRGSMHATADGRYRYPYILEGVYSMDTRASGTLTGGIAVDAYHAYRDTNRNGRIDGNERVPVGTGGIMFHSASMGSAGCQTIRDDEWPSFVRLLAECRNELGARSATYILKRDGGWI